MKSHDLAHKLTNEKRKKAEIAAEKDAMEVEMDHIQAIIQQVSPHLCGSGNTPPPSISVGPLVDGVDS